jgi:hypothetical protein
MRSGAPLSSKSSRKRAHKGACRCASGTSFSEGETGGAHSAGTVASRGDSGELPVLWEEVGVASQSSRMSMSLYESVSDPELDMLGMSTTEGVLGWVECLLEVGRGGEVGASRDESEDFLDL